MDYKAIMTDFDILYKACKDAVKTSKWKSESQQFDLNILNNVVRLQEELLNQTYHSGNTREFTLSERGKIRAISSLSPYDKAVRHAFCDNILVPKLQKYLIYDNGASIKGKGISHTRKRFEMHLHRYYRENKSNEGYILFGDFSKYYDNIRHDKAKEDIYKIFNYDPYIIWLTNELFKGFEIDVSDFNESIDELMNVKFNKLEYKNPHKNKKLLPKSVNIGDQLSQIVGIFYPHKIDNYIKIVTGNKYYGRYMDDFYVIHKDKEYLKKLLNKITSIAQDYGININTKKTRIVKLSSVNKFLQIRYSLTNTGKVIKRINPKRTTAMRRRLKKLHKKYVMNKVAYKDIENAYKSWIGGYYKFISKESLCNLNNLYNQLFIYPFIKNTKEGLTLLF
jgi:hypothetical protein